MEQGQSFYAALSARDRRFDGLFFVGVTSTRIYCRPVCTARTPKEANCRFFPSAALAEKQGFRPCLRCRPELAPGFAPVDDAQRIAQLIVRRLDEGLIDGETGLEEIAAQFELSSRQIRRIVQKELGVSPLELIQTRRLLLAKQLLTETALPVTNIAFASGFSSLRRFNDAFRTRYRMPPSRLRKEGADSAPELNRADSAPELNRADSAPELNRADSAPKLNIADSAPKLNLADSNFAGVSTVQLHYRPPYDWDGTLAFLAARTMKGAESADEQGYRRTLRIGAHTGWMSVRHLPEKHGIALSFSDALAPALPALIGRVRGIFDLDARPDLIAAHLMKDKTLGPLVRANPGLRVPGAFDSFEIAVRAILGQQVTVKAARTLAGRFVEAFGAKIRTPWDDLHFLAPTPERVAKLETGDIATLGIIAARANSIIAVAKAFASGSLRLEAGAQPDRAIAQLTAIKGIGPWTAHYIAMRALRYPDAFPKEDIALRNALGRVTPKKAEELSKPWQPWRSYALMHIWRKPV